ncbi:MAG: FkbM family methyltransferase [Verrucomicrobia bacterium]|nr:FkbM family methyltransferase [Verrucomicrobiota bacterium]MBV8275732.1 FkbM family methyltransferase [Verrucomicrobiota bacterium]
MNKLDSVNTQHKQLSVKISHAAIGEIYCLNEMEARATVHEVWIDELYLQAGISISAGNVVLDVGANIGVFTLYAAKQGAQVYAYEPMPPTYAVLQQNVKAHDLGWLVQTRNIGLSDRAEEKIMFHYPKLSVCDAWTAQDSLFGHLTENWENALEIIEAGDPDQAAAIRCLATRSEQQAAVQQRIKRISSEVVQVKCKFDTLSGVIAKEKLEFIDLLKLDAELADWEILNGVMDKDWERIGQVAMEVHVAPDVKPISEFLKNRGFSRVASKELKMGTGCIWAIK